MGQLFYFTGENGFLLREERRQWRERFALKHGAENMLSLDAASVDFRTLIDEVGAAPFIAEKRLVVIDGTPKFTKQEVEALAGHIHPDCILLICDPKPDKRLGGAKALLKAATMKEFPPLEDRALLQWMPQYAKQQGASIDEPAARLLLRTVGGNQEMLAREIEKLAAARAGSAIAASDVELLAVPSGEQEVWQLTNDLSRGDVDAALRYARTLLGQGEDPFSLWSILLWMLRSLVAVAAASAVGERNPAKIASAMGVPFPTARTLLPLASSLGLSRVRGLLDWAVEADIDLKTGGYRATGEAPEELLALIDQFIVRCGALSPSNVGR